MYTLIAIVKIFVVPAE